MKILIAFQVRRADYSTTIVETTRSTDSTPERSQIDHPAVFPKEWIKGGFPVVGLGIELV